MILDFVFFGVAPVFQCNSNSQRVYCDYYVSDYIHCYYCISNEFDMFIHSSCLISYRISIFYLQATKKNQFQLFDFEAMFSLKISLDFSERWTFLFLAKILHYTLTGMFFSKGKFVTPVQKRGIDWSRKSNYYFLHLIDLEGLLIFFLHKIANISCQSCPRSKILCTAILSRSLTTFCTAIRSRSLTGICTAFRSRSVPRSISKLNRSPDPL